MPSIASYVVRYDSGFAPNPFYGYCTLATCKPDIRKAAQLGDWIVGCGSNAKGVRRGGKLVYAMKVTEQLTFEAYSTDHRFEAKKPYRTGSRKQSCGDNIYFKLPDGNDWQQRDSFHSDSTGAANARHIKRDTGVNRVLISQDFVYFGGEGPSIPNTLRDKDGRLLCKTGIGWSHFTDQKLMADFETWLRSLGENGYVGVPQEWLSLRRAQ